MTPETPEGLVSAAWLASLMVFLVNEKFLADYIGVGAMRKALKGIADGSYSNLLRARQRAAAIASLQAPFPPLLEVLLGVANMADYLRRLFTTAGYPRLLQKLLRATITPDVWKELALALP
jgi:hypothetical protein